VPSTNGMSIGLGSYKNVRYKIQPTVSTQIAARPLITYRARWRDSMVSSAGVSSISTFFWSDFSPPAAESFFGFFDFAAADLALAGDFDGAGSTALEDFFVNLSISGSSSSASGSVFHNRGSGLTGSREDFGVSVSGSSVSGISVS